MSSISWLGVATSSFTCVLWLLPYSKCDFTKLAKRQLTIVKKSFALSYE